MARLNTTTTYSAIPNSGSHGAALRAALVAGFSYWTVGAVTSFGAGTTLREYFVLSHTAGHEVLIHCAGLDSPYNDGIYIDYRKASSTGQGYMSISYSPNGGFQASLTAGEDPGTQAFWDYITSTLGHLPPTKSRWIGAWTDSGSTSRDVSLIEDSTSETVILYSKDTSGIAGYVTYFIFSNVLYSPLLEGSGPNEIIGNGAFSLHGLNTAKPKSVLDPETTWWQTSGERVIDVTDYSLASAAVNDISSTVFPISDNKILTSYVNIATSTNIPARFNKDHLRIIPYHLGHNDKFGTDNNFKFIDGLARGWGLPWDNNEVNPT